MKKPIPWQTEEEAGWIKDYILLPLMLDMLERDIQVVRVAPFKMPEIYVRVLLNMQRSVTADLSQLRREMRKRGLKVYEERRTSLGVEANYLCRGYHHDFSMLWSLVRAEIGQRLCAYLNVDITEGGEAT